MGDLASYAGLFNIALSTYVDMPHRPVALGDAEFNFATLLWVVSYGFDIPQ